MVSYMDGWVTEIYTDYDEWEDIVHHVSNDEIFNLPGVSDYYEEDKTSNVTPDELQAAIDYAKKNKVTISVYNRSGKLTLKKSFRN